MILLKKQSWLVEYKNWKDEECQNIISTEQAVIELLYTIHKINNEPFMKDIKITSPTNVIMTGKELLMNSQYGSKFIFLDDDAQVDYIKNELKTIGQQVSWDEPIISFNIKDFLPELFCNKSIELMRADLDKNIAPCFLELLQEFVKSVNEIDRLESIELLTDNIIWYLSTKEKNKNWIDYKVN